MASDRSRPSAIYSRTLRSSILNERNKQLPPVERSAPTLGPPADLRQAYQRAPNGMTLHHECLEGESLERRKSGSSWQACLQVRPAQSIGGGP